MSEEWGPVIEHDGVFPEHLVGAWMWVECANGKSSEGRLETTFDCKNCWHAFDWSSLDTPQIWLWRVIRYRVRKPRGLTMLEEIARGVRPSTTPERERVGG